jgi:hypothetical protein
MQLIVIPAKAGIQVSVKRNILWTPASAGVTTIFDSVKSCLPQLSLLI